MGSSIARTIGEALPGAAHAIGAGSAAAATHAIEAAAPAATEAMAATAAHVGAGSAGAAGARDGALRIGIIGNGDLSWGSLMIHDHLLDMGHVPVYIRNETMTFDAVGQVSSGGEAVRGLDALLVRSGSHTSADSLAGLRRLQATGLPVLSPPAAIEAVGNKWTIAQMAERSGTPHPVTAHITRANVAADITAALGRFDNGRLPVVIKPASDMGGHGVVFQETSSQVSARSVADTLFDGHPERTELVMQQWLKEGTGRDLRVYFVANADGTVRVPPRGIERYGGEGKGQANMSAGGVATAHDLPPEVSAMATRLARESGLSFGSVDFVMGPKGHYMIEINSAAGLEPEVEQMIGAPVSRWLADMAVDAGSRRRAVLAAAAPTTG